MHLQHTAMPTVTTNPMVGPTTLQWQGFWSLSHFSNYLANVGKTSVRSALEAHDGQGYTVTHVE
jgi:hypothetical protein